MLSSGGSGDRDNIEVGPGGICVILPKIPCLILQIQAIMLELCPIMPNMPNYAGRNAGIFRLALS